MRKRTDHRPAQPARTTRLRTIAHRLSVRRPTVRGSEVESQIAAELAVIAERRTAI
jgi:hypothetical protein